MVFLLRQKTRQITTMLYYFVPGFLGKSVEDLSKAVTDLLVRQKQVTVGMPPHNEVIVSGGVALKSNDLICTIHNAFKGTVIYKTYSKSLVHRILCKLLHDIFALQFDIFCV